ncbi:MAG: anaerobic sulfatase maturase [Betaproteobacteria bacterium RIFCSPLOWO2_12_FULL_66_14]|nr:MAG: anaerobic sulfatase maturase [Betaproteobacteria bacterium RIFCSPLOWO2_12_FULL_66_14]
MPPGPPSAAAGEGRVNGAFQVLAKPAGAACNLVCRYCYYLHRPAREPAHRMRRRTLEAFVRDTIAAQPQAREIVFSWQGGEPALAGIDFFREALALQERYRPPGVRIENAFQTNGTLIDAEWTAFFAEHGFLVGVSIDGPARLHDPLRRDARGAGSHARALRSIERLARAGVEFNTLTVVHRLNYAHGREVYRFLRRIGSRYMQFIPLVERLRTDGALAVPPPGDPDAAPAPWMPPREGFGRFLCEVFDDWLSHDVGRVFVQLIEERVGALAGLPARLCVFAPDCSGTPMLEANGDLYSCDHYGYPAWRLGNIAETRLGELVRGERQRAFGQAKRAPLPAACLDCEHLQCCCGGCPKHRFVPAAAGPAENYLCPSYRRFFAHTAPALAGLARAAAVAWSHPE